jgi:hypothetical protein
LWHLQKYKYKENYGIVCHKDCYTVLNNYLSYQLLFSHVCRLTEKWPCILKPMSKYGPIVKYIGQDFAFIAADTENSYLLKSPLFNKKNRQRIIDIWAPLVNKFKKQSLRPSPCESATDFEEGKVLLGHDNTLYIVKNYNGIKKWAHYEHSKETYINNLNVNLDQFKMEKYKKLKRK